MHFEYQFLSYFYKKFMYCRVIKPPLRGSTTTIFRHRRNFVGVYYLVTFYDMPNTFTTIVVGCGGLLVSNMNEEGPKGGEGLQDI